MCVRVIVFCYFFFVLGLGIALGLGTALGLRFLFSGWVAVVDFIDKFSPQPYAPSVRSGGSSSIARMVFLGVDSSSFDHFVGSSRLLLSLDSSCAV